MAIVNGKARPGRWVRGTLAVSLLFPTALGVQVAAQETAQVATIPAATAGERLTELLAALNGDIAAVRDFAARNPTMTPPRPGPQPPSMLQMLLDSRQQSGGFDVLGTPAIEPTRAKLRVRNRLTGLVQELMVFVDPAAPHRIRGWGLGTPTLQDRSVATTDAARIAEVSAMLERMGEAGAFSGVVMIAREGKPIFSRAYGLADVERRIPNTIDTRFRLASLSKMFTGFAIGRLVEQGKLSYDDPLSKFVPDFPDAESAGKIRIKHLLSHTSGLPGFFPPQVHNVQKRGSATLGLAVLPRTKPESEPGVRWDYSNTGLLLLGRVIEVVTGQNYFDHIEQTMLKPLGLRHTGFPDYDRGARDLALPYERALDAGGKLTSAVPGEVTRWGGPAGDAAASAPDLIRFAAALEAGKVVAPATLRIHTSRKPELASPDYGFAIDFDFEGRDIYGHSGGAPGTCTQLGVIRDLSATYSFTVLANGYGGACRSVAIRIANTFVPVAAPGGPATTP